MGLTDDRKRVVESPQTKTPANFLMGIFVFDSVDAYIFINLLLMLTSPVLNSAM